MQGNIDIHNRPVVHNKDGSISTVRTISIGTDQGEVLIPTVVGGKVVSIAEAIRHYQQTGEHLGVFDSPDHATAYAQSLHNAQAREYGGRNLDYVTMMGESAGNPNAVSSAGARGRMQVMPSTARDPGFGIRPSNGSAADDERVGREYRAAMQKRYGGDLDKMWAAYNWGPGNLDRAIAQFGAGWLGAAPAETRSYITGNLRRLGGR